MLDDANYKIIREEYHETIEDLMGKILDALNHELDHQDEETKWIISLNAIVGVLSAITYLQIEKEFREDFLEQVIFHLREGFEIKDKYMEEEEQ